MAVGAQGGWAVGTVVCGASTAAARGTKPLSSVHARARPAEPATRRHSSGITGALCTPWCVFCGSAMMGPSQRPQRFRRAAPASAPLGALQRSEQSLQHLLTPSQPTRPAASVFARLHSPDSEAAGVVRCIACALLACWCGSCPHLGFGALAEPRWPSLEIMPACARSMTAPQVVETQTVDMDFNVCLRCRM